MGKTPSLTHQIKVLAQDHFKFGDSKYETRISNMNDGVDFHSATRDSIFSFKTANDFMAQSNRFTQYVKENFEVKRLGDIKQQHFDAYWKDNTQKAEGEKVWSPKTQKTYLDHLQRLNQYIQEKGWGKGFLDEKNMPEIPKNWKSIHTRSDRAMPHTKESLADLRSALPQHSKVIDFLTETGIRAKEMQRLRFEDIKGDQMTVTGKGGRERIIELSDKAKEIINQINFEKGNPKSKDKVFGDVNIRSLRTDIYKHNTDNGLPKRSLHSLRHTYAQNQFARYYKQSRLRGKNRWEANRDARGKISKDLGHGKPWMDQGRIAVTYEYVNSKDANDIMNQIDKEIGFR